MKEKNSLIIIIFLVLLIVTVMYNITVGAYDINYEEVMQTINNPKLNQISLQVLYEIRIPRIVMSILVGMALGISGAIMQTLFKNPLADPSIIGISSGATAGVAFTMLFMSSINAYITSHILNYFLIPMSAFVGAIITIYIIYKISTIYNTISTTVMLLAGIAINALFGSFVGVFTYLSNDEELRSFTFWTMGSLANADLITICILAPIVLLIFVFSINKKEELNLLLLGDHEASNMGVNVNSFKKQVIILVSLAVGFSVAFCGIIGFIGLIVPHLSRTLVGSNHKYLLQLSAILGAFVLLWADSIARVIMRPSELPIGIITSLIGAPFFLWLLIKNKKQL
jgi:iron complex transport system permease protein